MRVSFIIPPSGFLLDQLVFPTLGVLKVASVLEAAGVAVDVLDLTGVADVTGAVDRHLQSPPDAYGLTATMPQMPSAAAIAAQIRAARPGLPLVLGGPHVTLMQASARLEVKAGRFGRARRAMAELADRFDVLVCGDGELAIGEALRPDAPWLIDADDSSSVFFLRGVQLNEAPFPARHLIDLDRYHYAINGVRAQSLIGQLGCPFGCAFCGGRSSAFLRRVRLRSSASVVAEMRHLYEAYGTRGFMFFDDELNVNKGFMDLLVEIQRLQEALGVEFRIRGFLKAELLTDTMADAMYAAGFRQVLIGCESGSPRILRTIRKQATRDDNTRAVERLQRAGVAVKAAMSIGHPGESLETVEATRDWLTTVRPDDFDVSVITVYPGTPYYDDARETAPGVWTYTDPATGDRLHAAEVNHLSDVNFYKGIPHHYQSFVSTDFLTAEAICALRDDLEDGVRAQLRIPYPAPAAAQFDHSMGMGLS